MSQADRLSPPVANTELHRLLDVPAETDAALLRHAYEQQVAAALRSQDQARALRLSAALDDLPVTLRQQLYSRLHAHPASVPRRADSGWRHRHPGPEVEADPGPVTRPARRRWLAGFAVAVAVAIVAAVLLMRHSQAPQSDPQPMRPAMAVSHAPARLVPASARTAANGYVPVECPPTAQGPGYSGYARRGQIVRCGNGGWPALPLG
ncbi:MAG TPA: hypothetical protein VMB79_17425 [Jatrophihabitans sp.]|nr:hypothetical protein [Jatrophihabitans sp.]